MRFACSLFLFVALASTAKATEVDIGGGVEYFQWEEFSDSGRKLLDETGPRYFIEVTGTDRLDKYWLSDFGIRVYSGTVDYDGETQSGIPVTTVSDYNGVRAELGFSRHLTMAATSPGGEWLLRFALGLDQWRRSLHNTTLSSGTPVSGAVERYASTYAKLGASYRRVGLWSFGFGAKAPFNTQEEADISGGTVFLHPEGQLSLFAELEVPIGAAWSIALDYDSYRFAKSDRVAAGSYIYWQPESTQDTLSLAVHYRF